MVKVYHRPRSHEPARRRAAAYRQSILDRQRERALIKREYVIPAGVECLLAARGEEWKPFVTTKETRFKSPEKIESGYWFFYLKGWMLKIHPEFVSVN